MKEALMIVCVTQYIPIQTMRDFMTSSSSNHWTWPDGTFVPSPQVTEQTPQGDHSSYICSNEVSQQTKEKTQTEGSHRCCEEFISLSILYSMLYSYAFSMFFGIVRCVDKKFITKKDHVMPADMWLEHGYGPFSIFSILCISHVAITLGLTQALLKGDAGGELLYTYIHIPIYM